MAVHTGGRLRILATPSGYQFARSVVSHLERYAKQQEPRTPLLNATALAGLPENALLYVQSLNERVAQLEGLLEHLTRGAPTDMVVPASFARFADTEIKTQINDHIRGDDVYIIGDVMSQITHVPVDIVAQRRGYWIDINAKGMFGRCDDELIPLEVRAERRVAENYDLVLSAAEAAKRAGNAARVTVILPYFRSARQDRRSGRESLDLRRRFGELASAGVDHVLTLDPHNDAMGLAVPHGMSFDTLRGSHTIMRSLRQHPEYFEPQHAHFAAADIGKLASTYAQLMAREFKCTWGILYKERKTAELNAISEGIGHMSPEGASFVGKDVRIVDDMIDTGGSFVQGARHLIEKGARSAHGIMTHGVLSGKALEILNQAHDRGIVGSVLVTNSISLMPELYKLPWLRIADVTQYHAKVINRLHNNESISELLRLELT